MTKTENLPCLVQQFCREVRDIMARYQVVSFEAVTTGSADYGEAVVPWFAVEMEGQEGHTWRFSGITDVIGEHDLPDPPRVPIPAPTLEEILAAGAASRRRLELKIKLKRQAQEGDQDAARTLGAMEHVEDIERAFLLGKGAKS